MTSKKTHTCKFCKKKFVQEKTLASHLCVKKQRFADQNAMGPKMGLRVYQRFYEYTTNASKPRTLMDFIESSYYIGFVKFGRHLADLNPINIEMFVDYVIKNSIPLKDWTKDKIYETYLDDMMTREPPEKGLERTVLFIESWTQKNDCQFNEFFTTIAPTEATHLIRAGWISPWVLYLSGTAGSLFERMSTEQMAMISTMIDAETWAQRMTSNSEDRLFIQQALKAVKI